MQVLVQMLETMVVSGCRMPKALFSPTNQDGGASYQAENLI